MTTNPPTGGQPPSPNQGPGDDQPTYGQPQGQPQYGPPPSGPTQGQPQYGPPPSGPTERQPPYGPPQGQPPYGPPQGQPLYGPPQGQPLYGPPQGQPQYAPPVWGSTDVVGEPAAPRSAGGNRAFVPWIIGLVVLLVIGGGAFAVRAALGGGGDQPAVALPAGTLAYGRIDLDPAGAQKIAALRLAQKFPGFAEATGITDPEVDLRQRLWEEIQAGDESVAGIDYETDIEPWLGSRAAFAYVEPEDESAPQNGIVVALQVTDQDAAADGLEKLMAAGAANAETDEPAGVAFVGDYAVIALNQQLADAYAADAESASLADSEGFQQDLEALGDEGVASFWLSKDVYPFISSIAGAELAETGLGTDYLTDQGNLALALRFDDNFAEVAFAVTESSLPVPEGGSESSLMAGLPTSTLFALSTTYGREYLAQAWSQIEELGAQGGVDFNREIRQFERDTGLALPGDLATLLGEGFAFAVDSEGIDDFTDAGDPTSLRIGALLDTDPAAAQEVLDRLVAAAGGGIELETVETDGLLAVSLNAAYAAELTGGGLGESEAFQTAVPDGADADFALFFNMDAFEGSTLFTDGTSTEALDNLRVISAVGMSGTFEDGVGRGSLRVVVGE